MFDNLLESSHRDHSKKMSDIGFGEEITPVESIEVNFTHLIQSSDNTKCFVIIQVVVCLARKSIDITAA